MLDELGFVWEWNKLKGEKTWMKWYRELENYTKEHGHPNVPQSRPKTKLANWVMIQRCRHDKCYGKEEQLSEKQICLLNKLGFHWNANESKWIEQLEQLKIFKEEHGHCDVDLVLNKKDALLRWVKLQRNALRQGKLDEDKKAQLDAIAFSWASKIIDAKWEEMYSRLQSYHSKHGDADVPNRWKEDLKLAGWVNHQRQRKKNEMIPDEQIQRLNALGFTWQHRERGAWEDRYQELIEFREKNGHCNVPFQYKEVQKLGAFVNAMRSWKAAGTLSQERIELLEKIGFQWWGELNTDKWEDRYLQLLYFKEEYGHCNVPYNYSDNPQLGTWVINQRQSKKNGKMLPERERMLEEVGFNWGSEGSKRDFGGIKLTELWDVRYQELLEFKKQHGHCKVPYNFTDNPQLGKWVGKQRQQRKQNKLTPERERLLEEIGFLWSAGPESDEPELPQD